MKRLAILLCAAVALGGVSFAVEFDQSPLVDPFPKRNDDAGVRVLGITGDTCITQSNDNVLLEAGSVSCSGGGIITDNQFLRVYDLDGDHGIVGGYTPTDVVYGVETSTGGVGLSITLYAVPHGTDPSDANLAGNAICNASFEQADTELTIEVANIAGCPEVDGSASDLVVEVATEDCGATGGCTAFFIGQNFSGQIGDSYIGADGCGITNPVPLGAIGFPDISYVLDICGTTGGSVVPAMGPLGALATILVLGAGSGWAIRRRREA